MEKTHKWINEYIEESKKTYIYESPDNGKTIYRRGIGEPHETREKVK